MQVRNLKPEIVWNHFEDLNNVPRPSKKEEKVIAFMKSFGETNNLPTYVDSAGNVIIKKSASKGMENRKTVILQSHLDMVHQKNADTVFDFENEGIKMFVDGDWVTAEGTTLGADNGMGVAAIMSLLVSKDIDHPPLEALFTIDEETGMTGAFELEQEILDGQILLNLDTEDDDEFSIGCAGGIDTNSYFQYQPEAISNSEFAYELSVTGLKGGHSGMDIHLERANANKIMNRLMGELINFNIKIVSIDGGSLRNAIPRESFASIVVNDKDATSKLDAAITSIKEEFSISDSDMFISYNQTSLPNTSMSYEDSLKVIYSLMAVHNGVYRMSSAIEGLVETSSSLARVIVENGEFKTQSLQRSSVESSKMDIAKTVGSVFHLIGARVEHTGSYPGWAPNPKSEILEIMKSLYVDMYNEQPRVQACHAGLECGILNERYPGLDMISFGPTIRNPHSPDEKVHIGSVAKFWEFLLEVLKRIPEAN
ncbi:MAG: cytosol nonspecific dipeptidase [Crocinitomicaceae bacterium]|nr:cytosol nonspecific dipeptidase [Crocinitomicaceae bacterium]|tara:strand:+ start:1276 stop:2721 length:1446 start_codon:yes stop_codon:yes gene_type:complete